MQKLNIRYLLFKNSLYNAVQRVQIVPFAVMISPWSTNFFFKFGWIFVLQCFSFSPVEEAQQSGPAQGPGCD